MEADIYKTHGAFSWNELLTKDTTEAKRFYGKLLGWTIKDMPDCPDNYSIIKTGDKEIGGLMEIPKEFEGMPPNWGCYVTVDNVDERAAVAVKLGGNILVEARDIPNVGRFAVISDTQGAVFTLITYSMNK